MRPQNPNSKQSPFMAAPSFPFDAGDGADPDYLLVLRHFRPDGKSYALDLPAERAYAPPTPTPIAREYEPPNAYSDVEAEDIIPPVPHNVCSRRRGSKRQRGAADAVCVEEDFRAFLDHAREVNGCLVLEKGSLVANYGVGGVPSSGGEEEEEDVGEQVDSIVSREEEDDDDVIVLVKGEGRNEEEEEEFVASGKEGDLDDAILLDEDDDDDEFIALGKEEDGDEVILLEDEEEKGGGSEGPAATDLDANEWDWRPDPCNGTEEAKNEEEGLQNVAAVESPKVVKTNTSSSEDGVDDSIPDPSVAAGSEDGIWPRNIIKKPDSDFKRRLVCVLGKPFNWKEYDELLKIATARAPRMKLRQVRNSEKRYPTNELGCSYFDHYPDLAKQVESTNYRNGLALLRGFFFWLENIAYNDQFMPWLSDSKGYTVVL